MSAYFVPLLSCPVVIDELGEYITRSGERVYIERVSSRHDFGCTGYYADCSTPERWHKSGRISAGSETSNDVVRRA